MSQLIISRGSAHVHQRSSCYTPALDSSLTLMHEVESRYEVRELFISGDEHKIHA
jgi:hypothetical protein